MKDGDTYLMTKKSKGVGLCPYRFFIISIRKKPDDTIIMINLCSPDHNSTAVLVGDKLYAGTAADYQVLHHRDGRPDVCDGCTGARDGCVNHKFYLHIYDEKLESQMDTQ